MVTPSYLVIVSFVLQLVLFWFSEYKMPQAQPERRQKNVVFIINVVALSLTAFSIPLYHFVLGVMPIAVGAGLLALAIFPPVSGLIEARGEGNSGIFTKDRFYPHLATNVLGALAAAAAVWVGYSTPGFDEFTIQFKDEAALNIVLPLTTIVIFAFVRWQQVSECPNLDELVEQKDSGALEDGIRGFSLSHLHQLSNAIYLIAVTFMAAGMILYLFAFTLDSAKHHHPITLSWQIASAIVGILAFLFACGIPKVRKHQAVYLTFLTGTPAALTAVVVWLALMQQSAIRNIFAMSIIIVGYVLYSTLAVLGSRRDDKEKVQLHYFSAAVFAVVLTLLAGTLYMSP
jgi:hypothetical protein